MSSGAEARGTEQPPTNNATSSNILAAAGGDAEDGDDAKTPKRKLAICFGYVGEKYCGLQWNHDPTHPTVEEALLHALHRCGCISKENMGPQVMQKLGWERASRTDKGVHALKNLISVRLMLPGDGTIPSNVEALNKELPGDIHVFGMTPVTRSFNAHTMCVGRRYEYFLPTFALMSAEEFRELLPADVAPKDPAGDFMVLEDGDGGEGAGGGTYNKHHSNKDDEEKEELDGGGGVGERPRKKQRTVQGDATRQQQTGTNNSSEGSHGGGGGGGTAPGEEQPRWFRGLSMAFRMRLFRDIPEATMAKLAAYRVPKANVDRARQLMQRYVGTHSYHNFTPSGKSSDPSCIRYVRAITIDDPVLVTGSSSPCSSCGGASSGQDTDDYSRQKGQEKKEREERDLTTVPDRYGSGLEWVRIELDGQSFMLNQIRKMIGCVVSVMVAGLPDTFVSDCLSKEVSRGIPMAPANGLFLSYLDFTKYNLRLGRIQNEGNNGSGKEVIDMDTVNKDEERRLHRKIVDVIARREMTEDISGRWMRSARHVVYLAWGLSME